MKKFQLFVATFSLPLDYLMLVAAGLGAYYLRFETFVSDLRPILFNLPLAQYLPTLLLAAAGWVALLAATGLYSLKTKLKLSEELIRVFIGCSSGLALIVLWFFFNPLLFSSRFIVLAGWALALVFVSLGRVFLRWITNNLRRRGIGVVKVVLVGSDAAIQAIAVAFAKSPELGYRVVKVTPHELVPPPNELMQDADEVIVGGPAFSRDYAFQLLQYCSAHHLGFKYVADMFESSAHNISIHTIAGAPVIEIKRTPLDGWGRVAKRIFDVLMAGFLLVALSPLLLLVYVGVVVTSGWPPLVRLRRVGARGEVFWLYKFRSMVVDAENLKQALLLHNERADGPLFKMTNDPRITAFGRLLRKSSLDELPQLWNVVCGEMSLVGPRPHEPGEVERYLDHQRKLLSIKPGITGLAQVSGRAGLTFAEEAKLDTFYVEHWTMWQDIVILGKTLIVVMQRRAAV